MVRPSRLVLLAGLLLPAAAAGQNGTWVTNTAGAYNWSDAANWQGGIIADGANNAAFFTTAGLTGPVTVTLDMARTLGGLAFGNPTNSSGWTVAGVNPLTLSSTAASGPTIAVNNAAVTATISVPLAGSQGFTKTGDGTLVLTAMNTNTGGIVVSRGTLAVADDALLGPGPVNLGALGVLSYTANTTTSRSLTLAGGIVAVGAGATLTLSGSTLSNIYLGGAGTFATDPIHGAAFVNMTTQISATILLNSPADRFVNVVGGGQMIVAPGLTGPVTFNRLTVQGSESITVGAGSTIDVSGSQTSGQMILAPGMPAGPSVVPTRLVLAGPTTDPGLQFGAGSRTYIASPLTADLVNPRASLDLNGRNGSFTGAKLVNNGLVYDSTATLGTSLAMNTSCLLFGAGGYAVDVQTSKDSLFVAGNGLGVAGMGRLTFGPDGINHYGFPINDATAVAGPVPDASGQVSGWSLIKVLKQIGPVATTGDFTWEADPGHPLTVSLSTLLNPTVVGDASGLPFLPGIPGPMDNFDPTRSYSWPAVAWNGIYTGPADAALLNAATVFDVTEFQNSVEGTFGWSLDPAGHTLSLVYRPSSVPEPGTLILATAAAAAIAFRRRAGSKL